MGNIVNKKLNEDEAKYIIADENGTVEIPAGTEIIGERAFNCRKDIRKVILPEGIIKIEDSAFNACHNLKEINIPNTVRYIEGDAFAHCFELKKLIFPDGIKELSMGVCQHCSSLEEIHIPESVTLISKIAFGYCYHLTEVYLPSSICEIQDEAFDGCSNIKILAPHGSYAEQYAKMLSLNKSVDDEECRSNRNEGSQMANSTNTSYAFISYSAKNQDAAEAMREVLKKRGFNILMAPGDIPAESKYAEVINKAIKNCSCLILMLSEASQDSIWVAKEVERAVHYQKPIVPVQIENVVLNDEFEFYISTDQIAALRKIDESSMVMRKIMTSIGALLGIGQGEKEKGYLSTPSSDDITTVNRVMIKEPGFEFSLSYKYSGNVYFRHFEKDADTEYAFSINELFKGTFSNLLNKIYCAILGVDVITTRFNWLDEKEEYICKEIPKSEYGNRDDSCKGKFKVLCLEHFENPKFDSFEIGLRTNDFYILLYKHGGPGGYAYYGIDPNTPLSYFGIDEDILIDAAKELVRFAYPNKEVTFANKFHREDSSINNSGAVYNRLSFIVD